jgi:hypothetical protein
MGGGFGGPPMGGGMPMGGIGSFGSVGAMGGMGGMGGGMGGMGGMGGGFGGGMPMGGIGSMGGVGPPGGMGGMAFGGAQGIGGGDGDYDYVDLSHIKAIEKPKADPKSYKGKEKNSAFRDPEKKGAKKSVKIGDTETYHYEKESSHYSEQESRAHVDSEDDDDSDQVENNALASKV